MRIRTLKLAAGTGVVALLMLAAASGAGAGTQLATQKTAHVAIAEKSAAAKPVKITIKSFAFKPGKITAKVGQKITVTNKDTTAHTFTADKGGFDTKNIKPGGTKTFIVKKAGTYPFHCVIHQYMKGTLVVKK
jgi:plastocyanin